MILTTVCFYMYFNYLIVLKTDICDSVKFHINLLTYAFFLTAKYQ